MDQLNAFANIFYGMLLYHLIINLCSYIYLSDPIRSGATYVAT